MSIFKRLSATLAARIDQVVGEIENHDAVIQAGLSDLCKKQAEAKLRLRQVQKEKDRLNQQIQEQQENAQRWRERAVECAEQDETKALECIRRSRLCRQKEQQIVSVLEQYAQTTDKLARDIETSEQRITEMKQKLTLMRARQSTSIALAATTDVDNDAEKMLEDSFDRWEINISQAELKVESPDAVDSMDSLEREFVDQETQDELRIELVELLKAGDQK